LKKYFASLRPLERRLVVFVFVFVVVALNWAFIWPRFSDWSNNQGRLEAASSTLKRYQGMVAQIPELQKQLGKFETEGDIVAPDDQTVTFTRTIQTQSADSGVALQSLSRPITHTNDVFFIEQVQNINVLAEEKNLVDFLYKLGSGSSMIRVRDLTMQPDPPRQRLSADIRLVANYQKSTTATAAKSPTAMAK
jgi:Tfp pilus assembly protein PilO